jgi:septal ring-binding cell division protein DamX
VASPNENNLLDFAKRNSLNTDTAYYIKTTSEKSWFVLVHGVYSSRENAITGIEGLPDSLKKNTPYPVQIKYLHEVINQ